MHTIEELLFDPGWTDMNFLLLSHRCFCFDVKTWRLLLTAYVVQRTIWCRAALITASIGMTHLGITVAITSLECETVTLVGTGEGATSTACQVTIH